MHHLIDIIFTAIYFDNFSHLWCRRLKYSFSESFIVWQCIDGYQLRKNSCIRSAIEITLYFISWWQAEPRRRKIEIRGEQKIKSVKFMSSIKRKINVASCVCSPKAIIFKIQGPPAHSWKREDYLFMVSPLGKGRLDLGRVLAYVWCCLQSRS